MPAKQARRPPPLWPIRPNIAGITNAIVSPLHGDDFNDDLRHGATAANYQRAEPAPIDAPAAPSTASEFEAAARALTNPPDLTILGSLLGQLVMARLEPLPERQVLAAIKTATGIAVSILEKQICELRRRLNTTGNIHHRPIRPRWANQLRLDLAGTPERNEANVITALSNDEAFAGAVVFDEFRQEILIARALPWDQHRVLPRPWSDADDVRCAEWLQHREINVGPATVSRGINAVARDLRVHPVRDYLTNLLWDGDPRLEHVGDHIPWCRGHPPQSRRRLTLDDLRRRQASVPPRDWKREEAVDRGDVWLGNHRTQVAGVTMGKCHRMGRRSRPLGTRSAPMALHRYYPRRTRACDSWLKGHA